MLLCLKDESGGGESSPLPTSLLSADPEAAASHTGEHRTDQQPLAALHGKSTDLRPEASSTREAREQG